MQASCESSFLSGLIVSQIFESIVEKAPAMLVGGAHRGTSQSRPHVSGRRAHGAAEGQGIGGWRATVQSLACSWHWVGL